MPKDPHPPSQPAKAPPKAPIVSAQAPRKSVAPDPNLPQDDEPVDQAELDKDKPVLKPEEAEQLMRSGHKLRRKGDPPANWISMTRHGADLAIAIAATPENIEHFLAEEYIVAD